MNIDAELASARQHVHRSVVQKAMHARQWVSDEIRKAVWLAECEAAVALGKLRNDPVEAEGGKVRTVR